MGRLISNLDNNFAERIHKLQCKYKDDNKNVKNPKLIRKIVSVILNIETLMMIY